MESSEIRILHMTFNLIYYAYVFKDILAANAEIK